jgi:hypothetical protein
MGSQDFATHFLDEALFQDVTHINDLPLLQDAQIVSCSFHITHSTSTSMLHFLSQFDLALGI